MGVYKPRFAPFEPSGLCILSGPLSPASPLTPTRTQLHFPVLPSPRSVTFGASISSTKITISAPPDTVPWVWSCHKCHTRYALGATRRCLHDGHYFCGGTTVDQITGEKKRHRACASEFDYMGWEDFGIWKRAQRQIQNPRFKHCEDQCDFPSACHWKARHVPKKDAIFEFPDPKCLGTESKTTLKQETPVKKTGLYINRLIKSAEKRTSQLTTLLSTMDEESQFTSTPGYVLAPTTTSTSTPPKLPELNGLGLSFPVMDFSGLKKDPIDPRDTTMVTPPTVISPRSPPPQIPAALVEAASGDDNLDVDMTDRISEDDESPPTSPLPSPTSHPHPNRNLQAQEILFEFQHHRLTPTSMQTPPHSQTTIPRPSRLDAARGNGQPEILVLH